MQRSGVSPAALASGYAAFFLYSCAIGVFAVVLTLVRLMFTRRRLLEWETAAVTAARSAGLVGRRGLRQIVGHRRVHLRTAFALSTSA